MRQTVRQLTIYQGCESIRVIIVEGRAYVRKEKRSLPGIDGKVKIAAEKRPLGKVLPLICARRPAIVS